MSHAPSGLGSLWGWVRVTPTPAHGNCSSFFGGFRIFGARIRRSERRSAPRPPTLLTEQLAQGRGPWQLVRPGTGSSEMGFPALFELELLQPLVQSVPPLAV